MAGLAAQFVHEIDVRLHLLPDWLRRYVIALAELSGTVVLVAIILHTFGHKAAPFCSFLLVLLVISAAWNGYGPGLLVCALALFVVPRLLAPGRPQIIDPVQLALLVVIMLLISRLSTTTRRTEALLRKAAESLEQRVTERTQELQRSEQSRAWLAAIVEWSDDAIIGKTLDGTITSWNRGAELLYGYGPQEAVGRSIAMLVPPDCSDELNTILLQIRKGKVIQHFEAVRLHKDGRRIGVSLTISPIRDFQGAIQGASTIARDMTTERKAQQALADSEHRYRLLFENNPQPMWVYDRADLRFLAVNEAACRRYGYTAAEFLAMTLRDIRPPEDIPKLLEATKVPIKGLHTEGPWQHRKKDGSLITVEIREHPIQFDRHDASLVMPYDITERLKLEEQFHQAQRLESIGRLTVINGYTDMILEETPPESASLSESLSEVRAAGERAADLTKQLLAFSRRQILEPTVLNLNLIAADVKKLLRRLIGEDIDLVTKLSPDLGHIRADARQVEQILMNLSVNSRDAMPSGGTLLIETSNITFDKTYTADHPGVEPGPYVMLAITDNGDGMTLEVQKRIFEPFFTTKATGSGTGLGLATVHGIVRQSGGWIWVYSEPTRGTTFKIYFPRVDAPLPEPRLVLHTDVSGDETILVVEDQVEVRKLVVVALRKCGYSVHGTANAEEAKAFCLSFPGRIHLLLTDIVMPGINGRQLAVQLTALRPDLRVLFMSGYTDNAIAHHGVLDSGVAYVQKPFTPESLAERVREVLGPHQQPSGTILVVDDDESVRHLLKHYLTSGGYAVVEAANGRQAVEQLKQEPVVDLIVTDLVMPEQEGLETIQILHKDHPAVKVIAISGAFGGGFLQAAAKFGAHAALGKPISREDLLRTVGNLLKT
jgi:hypothetical protein